MIESSFRLGYREAHRLLESRLAEAAPSRIQLLTGPRQVGKTTLLLDLAGTLGEKVLYATGDGPEAALPGFWERFWTQAEETARARGKVAIFLDEVHHFENWAARLKGEWDRLRRRDRAVHVVATGSSALRLGSGSRESLAGRFERLTLSHWPPAALAEKFGLASSDAATEFIERGSYPGAFPLRHDRTRWTAYLRDSIVEPAISKDVLALGEVRRPALLRQVFAICASSPAQIVSLQKIQGRLQDAGALETVSHYLDLLEQAYLVASLEKHSDRPARRRAAPPKLVTLNNALLSAVDPRGIPERSREPERFGAWVENACLSFAWNSGQRVAYWREEPFEVDGVLEGAWGRWAVEVKTGPFGVPELRGLLEFTRRHPKFRPLVLCDSGREETAKRFGMPALSWTQFLTSGPPRQP